MNQIYFGDNLQILRGMPSESVDLIYIDPPFNTGKTQKRTRIKTVRSENGDRKGFQGKTYQTTELGTKAYQDSFDFFTDETIKPELEIAYNKLAPDSSLYFIEIFLRPRLEEAYRLLKPHGSLYFHIDYREVHYCKVLLDRIFGRDSFINEIIWAYDFGGRSKSRWPAKHDTILFYAKNPKKYIFNTSEIDREQYMAPGLVGPEKAEKGKLPTDTWFFPYVGKRPTDTWWQTIVGTSSKERLGYPTQKPRKLIDRIIRASTLQGNIVLDFFAGSGTVGESCFALNREFILVDNNPEALEVMAQRFSGINDIEWINFNPAPYQKGSDYNITTQSEQLKIVPEVSTEFQMLAATASYIQKDLEAQSDLWKDSPFEWVLQLPARKKGKLGRQLILSWLASKSITAESTKDSSETIVIKGNYFSIKFSTMWAKGYYRFQQIRGEGYDYLICFGISPFEAHCWVIEREYTIKNATQQHKGATEYWVPIDPKNPPEWVMGFGGSLEEAYQVLKKIKPNKNTK